jgi:FkbM family methyltransferase
MKKQEIKALLGAGKKIIFEVGCADGEDTREFISTFKEQIELHAFEPEPKNVVLSRSAIPVGQGRFNEGVVSDVDGFVTFHRSRTENPSDLSLSGSISPPVKHSEYWPHILFDDLIRVKSWTIDYYCSKHGINFIDFIWADVQGAELQLIKGGVQMLEQKVRYMFTEYSNEELYKGQLSLDKLLTALGSNWTVVRDYKTDVLLYNKASESRL